MAKPSFDSTMHVTVVTVLKDNVFYQQQKCLITRCDTLPGCNPPAPASSAPGVWSSDWGSFCWENLESGWSSWAAETTDILKFSLYCWLKVCENFINSFLMQFWSSLKSEWIHIHEIIAVYYFQSLLHENSVHKKDQTQNLVYMAP